MPARMPSMRRRHGWGTSKACTSSVPPYRCEWPASTAGGFDLIVVSEVGYFLSPRDLDGLVARVRTSLAPDGVVVLCHWRHEVVGWPLDGPAVHETFTAAGIRPVVARYGDRDVELLVLAALGVLPDPRPDP